MMAKSPFTQNTEIMWAHAFSIIICIVLVLVLFSGCAEIRIFYIASMYAISVISKQLFMCEDDS